MKLTFMDLCSGHGGTAEGFINAGFTGVGAFDINEHKLRFHKLNHPDTPIYKTNLLEINPGWIVRKIGKVNVLIITASCQGISRNGKFDFTHPLNVLLLRCIMMIPIISADAVVIENVDGLTVGEMKRLYNLVLRLLRGMKEYKLCDGILSAENYGTGQQRRRWICVLIKREIGIPSLPPPDTAGAELLRIKHIAPTLKFIKGGYHDENGIYHKIIRGINEWCFTITATPNAFNEDDELLSIPQVRKFCGYRDNYIYDEDHMRLAWKCFGDSVMPPMAFSIAMHIKKLLGESNDVSAARNFPIDGQIKLLCESNDVSAVGNLPTHAESIAPSISVREIIPVPVVTGMQKDITLLGDCLEVMPQLPDHSFDMIITDLPYGVTDHGWDKIIPPKLLWEQYKRLIKPDGAIVLFAQQPFTTDLINTNRRMFRYSMVWQKNRATGHLNARPVVPQPAQLSSTISPGRV